MEQGRHQPSPWPPGSSAPHPKLHPSRKSYINPSSRTPRRDPGPSTLRICLGPTDCGDKPGSGLSEGKAEARGPLAGRHPPLGNSALTLESGCKPSGRQKAPTLPPAGPGAQNRGAAPPGCPVASPLSAGESPASCVGPPCPHADLGVRNQALAGPHSCFRDEGVAQADPSEVEGRPQSAPPGFPPQPHHPLAVTLN